MPPRTRNTAKPPAKAAAKVGTFARLRLQALADAPEIEPYVIDDVTPPISIPAPETVEQQLALMEVISSEGKFRIADGRRILTIVCGDQFDAVWTLVKGEKLAVLLAFIDDMSRHFDEQGALEDVGEDDAPGGSGASST